jgi:hypothetical protein
MLPRLREAFVMTAVALVQSVAPAADGPRVILEAADGALEVRRGASFTVLTGAELRQLVTGAGRLIRFIDSQAQRPEAGPMLVQLTDGGRLSGRPTGGDEELLAISMGCAGPGAGEVALSLPVERLVALEFPERRAAGGTDWGPAAEGDRLYHTRAASGGGGAPAGGLALDRVDGFLEEFTWDGLLFTSDLGTRAYAWDEVGGLFLEVLAGEEAGAGDEVGAGPGTGADAWVTVDLTDGGRLSGALTALGGSGCLMKIPGCGDRALPAAAIDTILIEDGSLAFLSDLTPTDLGPLSPFGDELGMTWPARVDLSVTGTPLMAGGRRHARGLGVHAPSALTFAVPGWSGLRGSVALDDSARLLGTGGAAVFSVLLDGKRLWQSPPLRAADGPLDLPSLDLSGGRELVLVVDATDDGFAGDRADWLGLLLVR